MHTPDEVYAAMTTDTALAALVAATTTTEHDFAASVGAVVHDCIPPRFMRNRLISEADEAYFYAVVAPESVTHNVLGMAHLDTVVAHHQRQCRFTQVPGRSLRVHSGSLDDRLGAWVLTHVLPALGIHIPVVLTCGEESGASTAAALDVSDLPDTEPHWMIEFDRGGSDVVAYQFETQALVDAVEATGVPMGIGSFSDIAFAEHLGIAGLNWGVGYQDYHSTRGWADLEVTARMVSAFTEFLDNHGGMPWPHDPLAADDWLKYNGESAVTFIPEDEGVCDWDDWDCDGEVDETETGEILCATHREWYDEDIAAASL